MEPSGLRALRRGIQLLQVASCHPAGVSFTELGRITGVSRASLSRLLKVLVDEGLLRCDQSSGWYRHGPAFESMVVATTALGALPGMAQPLLHQLAEATGSSAVLVLAAGCELIIGAKHEVIDGCQHVPVGARMPRPLSNGLGRCLAAHMGGNARLELLAACGEPAGSAAAWEADLAPIRADQLVVPDSGDLGHFIRVAAPVFRRDGAVVAVIGISLPAAGASICATAVPLVRAAAQSLTRRLTDPVSVLAA
jgi:DNA-binding IclR family transcriptional regulator